MKTCDRLVRRDRIWITLRCLVCLWRSLSLVLYVHGFRETRDRRTKVWMQPYGATVRSAVPRQIGLLCWRLRLSAIRPHTHTRTHTHNNNNFRASVLSRPLPSSLCPTRRISNRARTETGTDWNDNKARALVDAGRYPVYHPPSCLAVPRNELIWSTCRTTSHRVIAAAASSTYVVLDDLNDVQWSFFYQWTARGYIYFISQWGSNSKTYKSRKKHKHTKTETWKSKRTNEL